MSTCTAASRRMHLLIHVAFMLPFVCKPNPAESCLHLAFNVSTWLHLSISIAQYVSKLLHNCLFTFGYACNKKVIKWLKPMASLDMLCTSISCLLRWVLETKLVVFRYCLASHQLVISAYYMLLSCKTQHPAVDR